MSEQILIVDDEPGIVTELGNILRDEGYRVVSTRSGEEAIEIYGRERPAAVFLDIWLPDRDGLEALQVIRGIDPGAAVIMMSGHGTAPTAVKAIKMGAYDYLEKPFTLGQVVEALSGALAQRAARAAAPDAAQAQALFSLEPAQVFTAPPRFPLVRQGIAPQRTIRASSVIYGLGLHSGTSTGMVLQPLPPDSGVHFVTLPAGAAIPAHISAVADTEWATTLSRYGEGIKTVEHLLSALHAYGITNLLIKVHGEIPVLDGSALEFCRKLEEIGVEDQGVPRWEVVIDRRYEVTGANDKLLAIEPADELSVSYRLDYPAPIGEQSFEFTLDSGESFRDVIAPARTFGFMRDLPMLKELGLGSGGRLDNFILVGEDNVVNTELRFPDEFVRHKILDIVGDLYLLGYPVRGRITARFSGHRDNVALQRLIVAGEGA
ncbi:MAG: UDP-3-O-acyl-N-acetylglucosamine deacetylase [Acidobacteriota bacterium]